MPAVRLKSNTKALIRMAKANKRLNKEQRHRTAAAIVDQRHSRRKSGLFGGPRSINAEKAKIWGK